MLITRWIAGTAGTSWSDRALLARKRAGTAISHRIKKRNRTGGVRIEPGWSPPHWSFVPLLSHPKQKTHVRTHVDPGRAPRRHPHLRRDPLFAIQNVRTYSRANQRKWNSQKEVQTRVVISCEYRIDNYPGIFGFRPRSRRTHASLR